MSMNLNEEISRIKFLMLEKEEGAQKQESSAEMVYAQQLDFLDNIDSEKVSKVAIVFPKDTWYEQLGTWILDNLGVIAGWFQSLSQALGYVKKLEQKGIKADQLVIGSHGSGTELLITQKEGGYYYDNSFLLSLKGILHPNSTIFFTACHGADFLEILKDAAEKVGVGTYGASGLYNYITNDAARGFYWCSPKAVTQSDIESSNIGETKKPYYYGTSKSAADLVINVPSPLGPEYYKLMKGKIKFKGGQLHGYKVPDIPIQLTGIPMSWNALKGKYLMYGYEFDPHKKFLENFPAPSQGYMSKENLIKTLRNKKSVDLEKMETFKNLFNSNLITIEIQLPNGLTDIKTLQPFKISEKLSNQFLLQNGFCKKVPKAPISWVDQVLDAISRGFQNLYNFGADKVKSAYNFGADAVNSAYDYGSKAVNSLRNYFNFE